MYKPLIFAIFGTLGTIGAGCCFATICSILFRVIVCASADAVEIGRWESFGLIISFATLIWNVVSAVHYIRILLTSDK